ncbi:MAG: glycosyltransferase family 1 protein [Chloroflexi bacterium]|uniref:Glycosyltransferase n=1 Tax=Candidatus Chlorohelix allophototropha TaxID=3003348 RepID=A0A8T7M9L0_9CHLR|nr:glycosyltransferase family 1 protein [Chloroflexota bacterium]WJW68747.1 glycosyltransferase [Chloroflexota bacterium L227-S17]
MLISILTTGTRGDTQPYIALGLALQKAGHQVRVAAFENYESFVKEHGLEFYPIKGDVSKVTTTDSSIAAMKADNPLKVLFSFNKLKALVFDLQKDFFNACVGADAVVYHPGAAIGYFIAQRLKIPAILATPFPMTPTRDYPALIFYNTPRLGKTFNLATHKIFGKIMWFASSSPVKQYWKQEFGHAPENFTSPFDKQNTQSLPTIVSCSNFVFPRPNDWSEHVYNTGYWFLEEEAAWKPSPALLNFLEKGAPPVYVGFGSIGDPALAAQTTALVIKALKLSGQRGILATGWSGLSNLADIPPEIFILESVPHSWLFPRMAAVVHHGGAGTTAAGLWAGVPSVLIPSGNDQFAWGRRVFELGVGAKPIPRKKLTAEKLAEAISFALTKEIKDAAKELGMKIQGENGAEAAAQIISNCVAQKTPA